MELMHISESLRQKFPVELLRAILQVYQKVYGRATRLSPVILFKAAKFKKRPHLRLNIGCGKVKLSGWVNIDIEPIPFAYADLVMDLRKGLPFEDSSVNFIYSEHFLEHLTYNEGLFVLKEFQRCLKKSGVVRVAMPDLDYIIQQYYNPNWANQAWLSLPTYKFIKTKGRAINVSFYWWGHKYLYNREDLRNQLINAKFKHIELCEWKKSDYPELSNLETRTESKLIMEAKK